MKRKDWTGGLFFIYLAFVIAVCEKAVETGDLYW